MSMMFSRSSGALRRLAHNTTSIRSLSTKLTGDYTVIDHEYDAIVVGAGGAGTSLVRGKV